MLSCGDAKTYSYIINTACSLHFAFKSLCHWNADDQNSLWNVLTELLQKFKQHHLKLLSGTLLEYEYNSLVDSTSAGFHYDDFEIYVTQGNGVRISVICDVLIVYSRTRLPCLISKLCSFRRSFFLLLLFWCRVVRISVEPMASCWCPYNRYTGIFQAYILYYLWCFITTWICVSWEWDLTL